MIEFIAGVLFTPIALFVLLIIALLTEHGEHRGWSLLFLIGAGVVTWKMFGLTTSTMLYITAVWVPLGIIWSMWRWRRHCSKAVKDHEKGKITTNCAADKINAKRYTERLVYWVIAWPISLIEMCLGDIIDVIEKLVTEVFKGTYARISSDAGDKIYAQAKANGEDNDNPQNNTRKNSMD